MTSTKLAISILLLLTTQLSYASCSDDWLSCRSEARKTWSDCNRSCNDSSCRHDCTESKSSDYRDCDTAKSECRATESSSSGSGSNNYQTPQRSGSTASSCFTQFGSCSMRMAVPIGSSCYCATPGGPIWGVAQ